MNLKSAYLFFPALFLLILPCLTYAEESPELRQAHAEFQKAFEIYTRLATEGGSGDINKALEEYKRTYQIYKELKAKEDAGKTSSEQKSPAAVSRPVLNIPLPDRSPGISGPVLNADRFVISAAPSETNQTFSYENIASLTIAAGTLAKEEKIFIHPMTPDGIDSAYLVPFGLYDVQIGNQHEFSKELTLEIPFGPQWVDPRFYPEAQLMAAYYDNRQWHVIPSWIDMQRNRIIIRTKHLTGFAAFAVRDDLSRQYLHQELEKLARAGESSFQAVSEKVSSVMQPVLSKATAAYQTGAGLVGKAWAKARSAYNSVSAVVGEVVDAGKGYANDVYEAVLGIYNVSKDVRDVVQTWNAGNCYKTVNFIIYYNEAQITDPTQIIYKPGGSVKTAKKPGENYFLIKKDKGLYYAPLSPTEAKEVPPYITDMAKALDAAHAFYKKNYKIPQGPIQVVVAGSNIDPFYEKISKFIVINHNVMTYEGMKTVTAHELFHLAQNQYCNILDMKLFTWLIESTAEYVSCEEVWKIPLIRERKISIGFLKEALDATGNEREYTAAHFIGYLAKNKKFDLKGFFEYFSKTYGMSSTLSYVDEYLKKKNGGKGLAEAYADFGAWLMLSSASSLHQTDVYTAFNTLPDAMKMVKKGIAEQQFSLRTEYGKTASGGIKVETDQSGEKEFSLTLKDKTGDGLADLYVLTGNAKTDPLVKKVRLVNKGDSAVIKLKPADVLYLVGTSASANAGDMRITYNAAMLTVRTELTRAEFSVNVSGGARYEWNFGDGKSETTTGSSVVHVYDYTFKPASGKNPFDENLTFDYKEYPVSVNVYDAQGKLIRTVHGKAGLSPIRSVK